MGWLFWDSVLCELCSQACRLEVSIWLWWWYCVVMVPMTLTTENVSFHAPGGWTAIGTAFLRPLLLAVGSIFSL